MCWKKGTNHSLYSEHNQFGHLAFQPNSTQMWRSEIGRRRRGRILVSVLCGYHLLLRLCCSNEPALDSRNCPSLSTDSIIHGSNV